MEAILEVPRTEIALTAAQTRLAEAQYEYKIAEVTRAYAAGLTVIPQPNGTAGP